MSDEKQPPGAAQQPAGSGPADGAPPAGEGEGAWGAGWRSGPPEEGRRLTRSHRQKVAGGVCGGLGRYFELDPVLFRVPLVVLSVISGLGLVFYGLAWLLLPVEGKRESELQRLMSGRIEGGSLVALVVALVGCAIFLAQLGSRSTVYGLVLAALVAAAAHWSLGRRRQPSAEGAPVRPAAATAQSVAEAPPEAQAPPAPEAPMWWQAPLTKEGRGAAPGWTPPPAPTLWERRAERTRRDGQPLGCLVFLLAAVAGVLGATFSWGGGTVGESLVIGSACALSVFGLGFVVTAFFGRLGPGSVIGAVVAAGVLAGASFVPRAQAVDWGYNAWNPGSVAEVQPEYRLGAGLADLDLEHIGLKKDQRVVTNVSLVAGGAEVVVPPDARVKLDIRARFGEVQVPVRQGADGEIVERRTAGLDRDVYWTLDPLDGSKPKGTVELKLDAGAGSIHLYREDPEKPVDEQDANAPADARTEEEAR